MKSEGFSAYNKYMILKHALKVKNVSKTCKLFGISRTTFYNWDRAYRKQGMLGLKSKEPQKPQMPNKVSPSIEQKILAYVERFPADGPKRIYYELKTEEIQTGESGIYNTLKRHNLTRREQREAYAKNRRERFGIRQGKNAIALSATNPEKKYPGYLVLQRVAYMGRFEGIGKIYQYSIFDTYSKWGAVKIYNKKQDIDVWDYFEFKLVYLMKTFHLEIENLITEKTKEFVPCFVKNNKHQEFTEDLQIPHRFVASDESAVFDAMNGFNEFLIHEFYNRIGTELKLDSFVQMERALHKFMRNYNFSRAIASGCHAGKVPAEVIIESVAGNQVDLDTLPLWILALLNSPKRGKKDE